MPFHWNSVSCWVFVSNFDSVSPIALMNIITSLHKIQRIRYVRLISFELEGIFLYSIQLKKLIIHLVHMARGVTQRHIKFTTINVDLCALCIVWPTPMNGCNACTQKHSPNRSGFDRQFLYLIWNLPIKMANIFNWFRLIYVYFMTRFIYLQLISHIISNTFQFDWTKKLNFVSKKNAHTIRNTPAENRSRKIRMKWKKIVCIFYT